MSVPAQVRAKATDQLRDFSELFDVWLKSEQIQHVPDVLVLRVLEYSTLYNTALSDIGSRIDQLVAENKHPPKAAGVKRVIADKCTAWTTDFARKAKKKAFVEALEKRSADSPDIGL